MKRRRSCLNFWNALRQAKRLQSTKHDQPIAKLVPATRPSNADLEELFLQMDEIRGRSLLNPRGKQKLTIKQLIEEGRK